MHTLLVQLHITVKGNSQHCSRWQNGTV